MSKKQKKGIVSPNVKEGIKETAKIVGRTAITVATTILVGKVLGGNKK